MGKEKILLKQINNYFNNYFKSNGWDCVAAFSNDFSYDFSNDIIYYSFLVNEAHDKLFADVCGEYRKEVKSVNNFILSLFHEIGHYMTCHIFTDDEWKHYDEQNELFKSKLECISDEKEELELYKDYYKLNVEMEATMWGCDYIVSHWEEVHNLYDGFKNLSTEFLLSLGATEEDIVEIFK